MARPQPKPTSDIAYLCRALKAPSLAAAVDRLARAGPRRGLDPRGVPRRLSRTRGRGPPGPRRREPHPRRPVPGPQDASRTSTSTTNASLKRDVDRPPRHPRLRRRHATTSCSSARPAPARPTSPPGSGSGPAKPATASRSPPPPSGSPASATPTHQGRLHAELTRLGRVPLLIIDEVGYIPFDGEAANLFFQLVSARYERASVIVTSNKPFGRWGEVFGDATVAAAMIDRLVHHAEVVNLKGDSYRLKDRDLGRVPTDDAT